MKIVHIITRFINGGADENTLYSCNWSANNGHDVTLIVGSHTHNEIINKLDSRVKLYTVDNLQRSISIYNDFSALVSIYKILKKEKPDIVHTHTSKAGIIGRFAASIAGVRGIVHGVHIAPFIGVGRKTAAAYIVLEKLAAKKTKAFIHVSKGMKKSYEMFNIAANKRHFVIHSGMDIDKFSRGSSDDYREILNISPDEVSEKPLIVLMIAALEPRKRHYEFFDKIDYIKSIVPNVLFVFAGGGPEFERLEKKRNSLTDPSCVKLLGFHGEPEKLISISDISVLCSEREGLPRVVVQYVAGKTPVVVSNLPGIDEIVVDGNNGYVVESDNMKEFSERIVELLKSQSTRNQFVENSNNRDLSSWSVENMCKQQDDVYKLVISG